MSEKRGFVDRLLDGVIDAYVSLRGLNEEKLENPSGGLSVRSTAAELRRGVGDDDDSVKRTPSRTTEEGTPNPLLWYGGIYAESYLEWLNPSTIRYDRYARYDEMDRNLPEIATRVRSALIERACSRAGIAREHVATRAKRFLAGAIAVIQQTKLIAFRLVDIVRGPPRNLARAFCIRHVSIPHGR
jgi:hypothetical protein